MFPGGTLIQAPIQLGTTAVSPPSCGAASNECLANAHHEVLFYDSQSAVNGDKSTQCPGENVT